MLLDTGISHIVGVLKGGGYLSVAGDASFWSLTGVFGFPIFQ